MKRFQRFKTVPGLPFLGVATYLNMDTFTEQLEAWAKEYGSEGAYEFNALGTRTVVLCSWETIEPMLAMRPFKVTKPHVYSTLGEITAGIFFSEGDQWKKERRLMAPAFNAKNVEQYAPTVSESVGDLLTVMERDNKNNGEVNFTQLLIRFTSEVITKTAWGFEEQALVKDESTLVDDINGVMDALGSRLVNPFPYYRVPGLARLVDGGDLGMANIEKRVLTVMDTMANQGKATVVEKLRKAEGEQFTRKQLVANLRVLLLAGSDTTSQALSWAFYHLASKQELQSQVAAEASALKEGSVTTEDLDALPLVKALWLETLRLQGAAPFDEFGTKEPLAVAGRVVPPHTDIIALYRYMIINSSKAKAVLGEDLEQFRPSRWLGPDGAVVKCPPFDTLAFGNGARMCLGMRLADFEGRLTIVRVLQRFRLKPWQGPPMKEKTSFVVKPAWDVKISLEPRT